MSWRNGGRTYEPRGVLAGPPESRVEYLREAHPLTPVDVAEEAFAALAALMDKRGPIYHCIPEEQERYWPQIAAARAVLAKVTP